MSEAEMLIEVLRKARHALLPGFSYERPDMVSEIDAVLLAHDLVGRHNKVAAQLDQFLTEVIPQLYCGECDRYERDPIFLDVERCGKCGELIEGSGDE